MTGFLRQIELAECLLDRVSLLSRVRVRDIDDMDEHARCRKLLQCRTEGGDELRRQLLDETYSVG